MPNQSLYIFIRALKVGRRKFKIVYPKIKESHVFRPRFEKEPRQNTAHNIFLTNLYSQSYGLCSLSQINRTLQILKVLQFLIGLTIIFM